MLLVCLLCGLVLTACGGGGSSDGGSDGGVGTLSTSLTDSTTRDYQAVYVTIARVDVHHDGDSKWETVAEPGKTYNLLELINGVRETLGIATLDAGHYTQMRLIIGETADDGINILSLPHPFANYVIDDDDDEIHELKVPSGTNTGLKIVNGFDINANQTTELILDFDASRSVVKAGSSGKYLLKPTVKVLDTAYYAIVTGTVQDDLPEPVSQAEALVTAQKDNSFAEDPGDRGVIEAGTVSAVDGGYALFLEPGAYNLVATKEGYLPGCAAVNLPEDSVTTQDLVIPVDEVPVGSITVKVAIAGASDNQHVTVEFRQSVDCGFGLTMITVKSVNIANGDTVAVNLPEGTYQVIASTYNKVNQVVEDVIVPSEPAAPPAEPDLTINF
jgi:hypothetical protein